MAVAESYAFNPKSEAAKDLAQKAAGFLATSHVPEAGWPDKRKGTADPVATAWTLLALKSAQLARLEIPIQAVGKALGWLGTIIDPWTSKVASKAKGAELLPTAAVMAARLFWKVPGDDTHIVGGAKLLAERVKVKKPGEDFEFLYFGTLCCFMLAGTAWKGWNQALLERLGSSQEKAGCALGSWKPSGTASRKRGRLGCTALGTLAMEISYRAGSRGR
jgi:hypothetical protein